MNPVLKNISGLVAGLIIGNIVNGSIVAISSALIPLPDGAAIPAEGASFMEMIEVMKENLPLMGWKDWMAPFLAHALGTLVGAFLAVKICATHQKTFALVVGGFFLLGGTGMAYLLEFPMPFSAIDLIGAYLPMGYLGWLLGKKKIKESTIPDDSSFV